jgi:prophage regulatory protein
LTKSHRVQAGALRLNFYPEQPRSRQMSQPQTPMKSPVAEAQASVFVRMPAVVRMTGLGRSTIYRLMAEDKFPSPVRLAKRAVAWRRIDLEQWSAGRPTVSH